MVARDQAIELRELSELYELMFKDAHHLLAVLTKGVRAISRSAYLNILSATLVLLIDGYFLALGRITLADIPSLVAEVCILIVAGLIIVTAARLLAWSYVLHRRYNRMILAAKEFRENLHDETRAQ